MYGRAKYGRSSGSIFSILVFDLINIVTNAKFSINASIKDILSIYTLFRQTITQIVQDIISILHVFSCTIYGLRKYKKKIKEDEEVEKSIQNRD